jgi:16S rRNA (guanine966-N2)-methyltransferase
MNRGERELRIIGGRFRGRKLHFPEAPGLRPTPDRVRETLFNWLQQRIPGARCLDLFAGSGALGLEALSRGAAHVCFVESHGPAARELTATLERFGASAQAEVHLMPSSRFLAAQHGVFDVVFLDPPFASGLLAPSCARLAEGGFLAPDALVYVETAAAATQPTLPAGWRLHRGGKAGEVGYHLYTAHDGAPSTEAP